MTEAKSTQPQLPPRPSGENSMKLNVEYIREWLADYKATFGNVIPSAGLPTSHVVGNVEWLLAENESLKARLMQVDDVLVVNWITVEDGDYREALHKLITYNIAIHDDRS